LREPVHHFTKNGRKGPSTGRLDSVLKLTPQQSVVGRDIEF
jgi:hypothetical protein